MRSSSIESLILGNTREVRVQTVGDADRSPVVLMLDAEYYVEKMNTPAQIASAAEAGLLPSARYAYISHIDGDVRWPESFCSEDFARFLGTELVPWLKDEFEFATDRWFLGGLSLTGLAAVHAALAGPFEFHGVFAQSGSLWWNDNWLAKHVSKYPERSTRFRISCGSEETAAPVDHGSGLVQTTPQLESNERFRDALLERGYAVDFECFHGGHRLDSWSEELPRALASLLNL